MRSNRFWPSLCVVAFLAGGARSGAADAAPSLEVVHRLIKPRTGESQWMQVPWLTSVWEARQKAAEQGKPIFIWAGSGGGPAGVC